MHKMQPKVAKILTRVGGATGTIIDKVNVSKVEDTIMNIEIADKLVKLRKQNGYSQEELADKLGLSRQAVSKWERAEASPDTDNLICLAKLYNISLDELLSTEDDVDTIVKEQVKKDKEEEKEETKEEKTSKKSVHIGNDGIHAIDDDGSEVIINDDGIKCYNKDGSEVEINSPKKRRQRHIYLAINSICMSIALITYLVLGITLNLWSTMWIIFFIPDMIASIFKCIFNREFHSFNMAFAATFTFFLICLVLLPEKNLWHPMWVVFLAIPIYYSVVSRIEVVLKDKKDNVIDDDDNEEAN